MSRKITVASIAFDGGNANLKYRIGSGAPVCVPAWAVKLEPYQQPGTALVAEVDGERWAIGEIAQDLGGQPIFQLGKREMTPVLLKAVLGSVGAEATEALTILVPDERQTGEWNEVRDRIGSLAASVRFVNEGIPPYEWACDQKVWQWPDHPNGVLDAGGGELSLILFTRSGVIDWGRSIKLPGTKDLAQNVANRMAPLCAYNPSAGDILRGAEDGSFVYADEGRLIDYREIFESCRLQWLNEIRSTVRDRWQSQGLRIGQVLMCGGGAHLLKDLEGITQGRFFIADDPSIPNFAQVLNAWAM